MRKASSDEETKEEGVHTGKDEQRKAQVMKKDKNRLINWKKKNMNDVFHAIMETEQLGET